MGISNLEFRDEVEDGTVYSDLPKKTVVKIGIGFSKETRTVSEWKTA